MATSTVRLCLVGPTDPLQHWTKCSISTKTEQLFLVASTVHCGQSPEHGALKSMWKPASVFSTSASPKDACRQPTELLWHAERKEQESTGTEAAHTAKQAGNIQRANIGKTARAQKLSSSRKELRAGAGGRKCGVGCAIKDMWNHEETILHAEWRSNWVHSTFPDQTTLSDMALWGFFEAKSV